MPLALSAYPVPAFNTGLGVHGGPNLSFPMGEHPSDWPWWADELQAMGVTWLKLLSGGTSALECARYFMGRGIMPVVRLFRASPNPGCMVEDDPLGRGAVAQFVAAGVKYFEVNNEPNLLDEWAGDKNAEGVPAKWQQYNPYQPDVVADSWLKDARFVLDEGGFPAVPAMAPGGHFNDMDFLRGFFEHIIADGKAGLMAEGVWLSVHPAALNHPIDYPADNVNQRGVAVTPDEYGQHEWAGSIDWVNAERVRGKNPGQTLLSVNADGKDTGGSIGWQKWRAVGELFHEYFGFYVPVIGTEGGWWPNRLDDPRYFKTSVWDVSYNTRLAAEAMMRGDYPGWFFATGHWSLASKGMGGDMVWEKDTWYSPVNGNQPVIDHLKAMVKTAKPAPVDVVPPVVPDPPPPNVLTDAQIVDCLGAAGFDGEAKVTMFAIILWESGGDASARNGNNPDGGVDRGLVQIHFPTHAASVTIAQAYDPRFSCQYAFTLYQTPLGFGHWSGYNSGDYLRFLDRARAACGAQLPSPEELRRFAWESCIGVPEDAALMRRGRELGLVPICGEGRDMIGCGPYVGQVFTDGNGGMVLLYCRDQAPYSPVYQQAL